MKVNFKSPFSVAIAMSFGLVVLAGYFFGTNAAGETSTLGVIRDFSLRGAVILTAVALLVGISNLVSVHTKKIRKGKNVGYRLALLLAMLITMGVGIYDILGTYFKGELTFQRLQWFFDHIQLPVEISLMAILTVSLTYAAARLLGKRMTVFTAVFVGTVLILLIGAIPQLSSFDVLSSLRNWVVQTWAVGGARGILLGVALGTIATGIRILMGSDRPYGG
jgi:cytochrome bd-type quinol oxidase subunit 2